MWGGLEALAVEAGIDGVSEVEARTWRVVVGSISLHPPPWAASLPDDLDQDALAAAAIEFAVEYLLPRPEVQPPVGDGHHHLAAHDLPLQVGIGVVLAGLVVLPAAAGVGRQLFQPLVEVLVQAASRRR